jgi:hypothetical protein
LQPFPHKDLRSDDRSQRFSEASDSQALAVHLPDRTVRSRPGIERNEEIDGLWNDFDPDWQVPEQFPVGFSKDARQGAVVETAVDRDRIKQLNLTIEGMPVEHDRQQEPAVLQAAPGLESYQAEAVVAKSSARGQIAEDAAKVADPHRKEL